MVGWYAWAMGRGAEEARASPPRMLGRYALYEEIASGRHGDRALRAAPRPGRLLAHGRDQAAPPAVRQGSRVRLDVPRRGAPRRAHPAPERRPHARRRRARRASSSSSWSTCRASRSRGCSAPRAPRRAHSAARSSRRSWPARSTASTPRTRRRTSSGEPLGIVHRDVSPQNILVGHRRRRARARLRRRQGRRPRPDDARGAAQGQARVHGARADPRATCRARPTSTPPPSCCGRPSPAQRLFTGDNDAQTILAQVAQGMHGCRRARTSPGLPRRSTT